MTPEQVTQVRSLRARRYSNEEVAHMLKLPIADVKQAMRHGLTYCNKEAGEEQVIDGEPIAQRIERMKAEIRNRNNAQFAEMGCRNYYDRGPRHYCEVPAEIR